MNGYYLTPNFYNWRRREQGGRVFKYKRLVQHAHTALVPCHKYYHMNISPPKTRTPHWCALFLRAHQFDNSFLCPCTHPQNKCILWPLHLSFLKQKKSNSKPIPQSKSSEIYAKHYQKQLFFWICCTCSWLISDIERLLHLTKGP
jgi:hypothetical protein